MKSLRAIALLTMGAALGFACSQDPNGFSGADAASDAGASDATTTPPDSPDAADAGQDGSSRRAVYVAVGTNYVSAEAVAFVDGEQSVRGPIPVKDQDTVVAAGEGYAFLLHRTTGDVTYVDLGNAPASVRTFPAEDLPDAAATSNPHAAAIDKNGTRAVIGLYARNKAAIVDLATGKHQAAVDLSMFVDGQDPDGLVDIAAAATSPVWTDVVYLLLQRIDQFDYSGTAPDYVGKCLSTKPLLVGVEVHSGQIVDVNGNAPGLALELAGANPQQVIFDEDNHQLLVVHAGCYDAADGGDAGTARMRRGVERVDLATNATSWLKVIDSLERPSQIVLGSGGAGYLSIGSSWTTFDPQTGALGAAEPMMPAAPRSLAGRIVGLARDAADAGSDAGPSWRVVELSPGLGHTTLAEGAFKTIDPDPLFGISAGVAR